MTGECNEPKSHGQPECEQNREDNRRSAVLSCHATILAGAKRGRKDWFDEESGGSGGEPYSGAVASASSSHSLDVSLSNGRAARWPFAVAGH